ncbi:TPA: PhoX family phosphatase [Campylobacter jejuni]|nr:PhoX family phosphatase [Campylobacter jejuni]ELC0735572.1 PhoX family phosphatase [Campylobacter jejuni]HEC1844006.1 PhoX family phosphatase [Campylobacter jejuni]HEG1421650.1 PhoX family phosphatase [Campylobacter jejuni]HEG2982620.1 PhoX family phosphatase [Campylobacter jejuni]
MERRLFLKGSALGSMVAFFASSNLSAVVLKDKDLLGFKAVSASTQDKVIVPQGYEAKVLISWGDPLFSKAKPYDENKIIDMNAVKNAHLVFGDNDDGMSFFPLSKNRGILAVNNEYINPEIMFNHHGKNLSKEDILYEQASVGVSILEIEKKGDDEMNEFIYKFVSKHKYKKDADTSKILDEGILYVGQFNGKVGDFKGQGKWIALEYGKNSLDEKNGFKSQAQVLINTRLAASIVGATPMDRCEWIASHKQSGSKEVFATLTNNKNRQEPNAANPRTKNVYGQILKWMPKNSHKDDDFTWEIFALAGNPDNQQGLYKGSNNITSENKFNSPDGLKFDRDGRLWIQTDGSYSNKDEYEGMGNNCMLAANPKTGEIRRFLTGPIACELTGIAFSEDYTTMFVGIQHPGEGLKGSTFPYGKTPRSSVIMIRKLDGGVIGS